VIGEVWSHALAIQSVPLGADRRFGPRRGRPQPVSRPSSWQPLATVEMPAVPPAPAVRTAVRTMREPRGSAVLRSRRHCLANRPAGSFFLDLHLYALAPGRFSDLGAGALIQCHFPFRHRTLGSPCEIIIMAFQSRRGSSSHAGLTSIQLRETQIPARSMSIRHSSGSAPAFCERSSRFLYCGADVGTNTVARLPGPERGAESRAK
jgi:hypothetical protein